MRTLTIALVLMTGLLVGCTKKHYIAKDYPQYLTNNVGASKLPKGNGVTKYALTPATAANQYSFRSSAVGKANLWIVEFGKIMEATMQSKDVLDAFGPIAATKVEDPGEGVLVFDLVKYEFTDMHAVVELKITRRSGGQDVASQVYKAEGDTQRGKTFWGGAFAMKNAVQQSTKGAVDQILRSFIADLNAQAGAAPAAAPTP